MRLCPRSSRQMLEGGGEIVGNRAGGDQKAKDPPRARLHEAGGEVV